MLSQVMNKNTELACAHVQEVIEILRELPTTLAGCKEPSLLSQAVNKNTELTNTHAQEVIEILGESPYHEIGRAKMVATGENLSCKSSMMDALRLNDESAAGNSKKEDSDEKKSRKSET